MKTLSAIATLLMVTSFARNLPERPNIVIIYGDDVGYGDLNEYGHPTSSTPNLKRMSEEGLRILQFYSAASICSPSRASLMTGRLYPRTGVYSNGSGTGLSVFNPESIGGMLLTEITVAEMLKQQGYATGAVGKWHLGVGEDLKYFPTKRGFDTYYGLPMTQSECMSDAGSLDVALGPCPVFRNEKIIAQPADILNIDQIYVENAKEFITEHQHEPFFFYFASHHTHRPQFASTSFRNTTLRGLFGDSLAELDYSVGQVLDHLVSLELQRKTLVIFTSDNGPELKDNEMGGEQGPLKCGKGTTYEGGVREPAIFWWPGVIAPNTISYALGSTLDISVTAVNLAGGHVPDDRPIDGYDLTSVLTGESPVGLRQEVFYYSGRFLMAVRFKQFKAHFWTMGSHCLNTYHDRDCWDETPLKYHDPPLLFNVEKDPKERVSLDVSVEENKKVLSEIVAITERHNKTMTFGKPMISQGNNESLFPCCSPSCSPRPTCCKCLGKDNVKLTNIIFN
eukprot:m.42057 g.42057  ORF g.42057 m.42057 type:complete len:508 (+) comp33327_c0_seq4:144-1667(+)